MDKPPTRVMEDEKRVAEIVTSLCQGCGVCAMVCPQKTTQQNTFNVKQILLPSMLLLIDGSIQPFQFLPSSSMIR